MSEQGPNSVPPTGSAADELRELLPDYALGTLTPTEHIRVQQLLDQHPEMLSELDSYLALAEGLLLNVEPMQPSPGLRSRLLDQLAAEEAAGAHNHTSEQDTPDGQQTAGSSTTTAHSAPTSSRLTPLKMPPTLTTEAVTPSSAQVTQTTQRVQPEKPAGRSAIYRIGWGLAAACLALLVVTNIYWFIETNNLRSEVQDLQSRQDNLVSNILAESVHHVTLVAADFDDTEQIARIAWNEETEQATFYGGHLPEIASDQVYQLWLLDGQTPISAAVFTSGIRGSFNIFHADMAGYTAVALTVEPEGGSETPTSQPFAIAELG
jgi:anti-sigma-K factor RskA